MIQVFKSLGMADKRQLSFLQLSDDSPDPLPFEIVANLVREELSQVLFLHNEVAWYPVAALSELGQKAICEFLYQLVKET